MHSNDTHNKNIIKIKGHLKFDRVVIYYIENLLFYKKHCIYN